VTIGELKILFETRLSSIYPSEELQSFFSMLINEWLGFSRFEISLKASSEIDSEMLRKFTNAMDRLEAHEPIQYIIGHTEFYGIQLKVTSDTLIPRPETEELVDLIIRASKNPKTLLDIGTGSGCIAIALSKELSDCSVSALDISEKALEVARENASENRVSVDFFREDILSVAHLPSVYDVIVSNPPYVREHEKQMMQENVWKYEPQVALYVPNNDPLLFYRKIAKLAGKHLKNEGLLFFEINEYLSKEMVTMLQNEGFDELEIIKDFRDCDRMIKCIKHA